MWKNKKRLRVRVQEAACLAMTLRSGRGRFCQGFTLLEILVTVAVLAVLIALIFPGVNNAIQGGRKASCIHNLRQIGKANALYAAENNSLFAPGSVEKDRTFSYYLAPYLGGMKSPTVAPDVFYCPETIAQKSPPALGFGTSPADYYKGWAGYFLSYFINSSIHANLYVDPADRAQGKTNWKYPPVRLPEVQMPTKTVSLMEMTLPWSSSPPSSTFGGAAYFDPKNGSFAVGMHHRGTGNILFVDGHVESFGDDRPIPVATLPSQTETWH